MTHQELMNIIHSPTSRHGAEATEKLEYEEKLFKRIIDNDFSHPLLQREIMQQWWRSPFSHFVQVMLHDYPLFGAHEHTFVNKLDWLGNFMTHDKPLFNGTNNAALYARREMSFFHMGLLSHWSLLRAAHPHIDNLAAAINLVNSMGQNSFHVLVNSLCECPRADYHDVFALIARHNIHSLSQKDDLGETPLEMCEDCLEKITTVSTTSDQSTREVVVESLYKELKKLRLAQELEEKLSQPGLPPLTHKI